MTTTRQKYFTAIAKARLEKGLTREKAAELIGVSTFSLYEWESGKRIPRHLDIIRRAAKVYGVSLSEVVGQEVLDVEGRV